MKETDVLKPSSKAPDGGWSWVVVACAFYNSIILGTIPVTFGIVFNGKMTQMEVPSTIVGLIYNLFNFNFYISSIFCGFLSDKFGWRKVGFVSATITGVAYTFMFHATGPGLIFILFSVISGYGAGLASFIGFLTIPHYFDRHRGRAKAIIMTGVCTGQVIIPQLVNRLLDVYSFPGVCLILAGLIFNCAVFSLLFYPMQKRPILEGDMMYEAAKRQQKVQLSLKEITHNPQSNEKFNKKRPKPFPTRGKFKEIFSLTWNHMCQVKHMPLVIVTLSFAILNVGFGNFTAILPFAMVARSHTGAIISSSLSMGGAVNTVTRFFVYWASDKDWFSRKICYILGSIIAAVSAFGIVFVLRDAQLIRVCLAFWSFGIGSTISVFHNLVVDTCGSELSSSAAVISSLLMAVCNIALGPLIGVVRDYTSYEVAIGMTAALQLACSLLWFFMPLARRYDLKKFPDRQSPKQKSERDLKQGADVEAFKHERADESHINIGFIVDSGVNLTRRHSAA